MSTIEIIVLLIAEALLVSSFTYMITMDFLHNADAEAEARAMRVWKEILRYCDEGGMPLMIKLADKD